MRYIKLYYHYFKTNIKKLLEYKSDFLFNLISVTIWVSAGLLNIYIIFTNLKSFDGWNFSDVGLLYGMWSLTFSIYNAFGQGIMDIESYIVSGRMDNLLTKPVNPLFQLITSKINTMGIGFLLFGVISMIYFALKSSIIWSTLKIIYIIIAIISGGLLIFGTYLIIGCLAFWTLKSSYAIKIGYDVHKFSQYPISIYGKEIRILLICILPYAFTNYFPVAFLLGKSSIIYGVISPIICIIVFVISLFIWKLALKKYEGSGS